MTKDQARASILAEWGRWAPRNVTNESPDYPEATRFWVHLQRERADLLDFRDTGDKWQTVHGWLRQARKVERSEP